MTEKKAMTWKEFRAKRPPNEDAVADHLAQMVAEERTYRLREIREEAGLTQSEVARRLDLTQPAISALPLRRRQKFSKFG